METDFGLHVAIIHARIDESAFVRESVTESVGDLGQAGVESAHIIPLWDGVMVRVGMAEEDFEGRLGSTDFINGLHNGFTDGNGLWLAYDNYTCKD